MNRTKQLPKEFKGKVDLLCQLGLASFSESRESLTL